MRGYPRPKGQALPPNIRRQGLPLRSIGSGNQKERGKPLKKKWPLILILLLMLVGLGLLLYPTAGNLISKITSTVKIQRYQQDISKLNDQKVETMWKAAQAYNARLSGVIETDAFSVGNKQPGQMDAQYMSLLDVNGLMGYVEIPSIQVYLPIYHGTTSTVLQKGAGHLEGSALPVGGPGTNPVITAHRGLPSAKLFTDLDQLELGDDFYLHILGRTLAYRVDQISVIKPSDTKALDAIPGQDHATLLTCTPYGINTERLVVRGVRVAYSAQSTANVNQFILQELQIVPAWVIVAAGVLLVLLIRAIWMLFHRKRKP